MWRPQNFRNMSEVKSCEINNEPSWVFLLRLHISKLGGILLLCLFLMIRWWLGVSGSVISHIYHKKIKSPNKSIIDHLKTHCLPSKNYIWTPFMDYFWSVRYNNILYTVRFHENEINVCLYLFQTCDLTSRAIPLM